jgi:hypothetical protein
MAAGLDKRSRAVLRCFLAPSQATRCSGAPDSPQPGATIVTVATQPQLDSLNMALRTASPLVRLSVSEAGAVFSQMTNLGYVINTPGSTGNFLAGYSDFDLMARSMGSSTALGRLSLIEQHAVYNALTATGYLITKPAPAPQTTPVSVTETSTTLLAGVPAAIAPAAASSITRFIIANNGTGSLVWKTNSLPTSSTDGTPLDPASSAGGQGGAIVLTDDVAISDPIYAWSTAGTTVNVKQA